MSKVDPKEKLSEFVQEVLGRVGVDAEISVSEQEGDTKEVTYLQVVIDGEDLGYMIGHHGKTLQSFQTIFGLWVSKEFGREYRVLVDINGYREKQKEYLESLAMRALDQVLESGQDLELEPMKPAERRIVHMVLKDKEEVTTESVGEGMERRIVIKKV